jgi:hypothetical protein
MYKPLYLFIVTIFLTSCGSKTNDTTTVSNVKMEEVKASPPPAVPNIVNDEIFDGYKFGMSKNEAMAIGKKNNDNLITSGEDLKGKHLFHCEANQQPAFKVVGNMKLHFKKDKLYGIEFKAKEAGDISNEDLTTGYVCKSLARYLSIYQHTPFETAEDDDGFDVLFWKDTNRTIKIYQTDFDVKANRCYNIAAKDESI